MQVSQAKWLSSFTEGYHIRNNLQHARRQREEGVAVQCQYVDVVTVRADDQANGQFDQHDNGEHRADAAEDVE